MGDDSPRIDYFEALLTMGNLAVNAVARNTRFISHDGPALTGDRIKQRRLADVGSAHDNNGGQWAAFRHLPTMIACTAYEAPYVSCSVLRCIPVRSGLRRSPLCCRKRECTNCGPCRRGKLRELER